MSLALTIHGPYKGYSGHDCTVRSFVRHLVKAGASIALKDIPHWSPAKLLPEQRDEWFDKFKQPNDSNVALHFCMPHQVGMLAGKININFTMFEATRIPEIWVRQNQQHDLVILPTESSKRFWCDSGFPEERIRLCPLGVDTNRFRPDVVPLDLVDKRGRRIADYRVRVLNISEIVVRKNLLSILRVWIQTTRAEQDAILIVKLNHGRLSLVKFLRDLTLMEREIGKDRSQAASILFLDQVLSDDEMPGLYTAATHYWSMSHGEGWDQPMTEAGASGLRLIAPDHTAYQTYLDQNVACLLPCKQVPVLSSKVEGHLQTLFKNAEWWEPDETVAAEAIDQALSGTEKLRSADLRERLKHQFNWDLAAERLLGILQEM